MNLSKFIILFLFAFAALSWAAVTGTIAGTVTDPSSAGIAGITVVVTNSNQGIQNKATTDEHGDFAFPSLPVGTYQLEVQAPGFRPFRRNNITINADSALKEDVKLELAQQNQEVTVAESTTQVESESTQIGEVVSASTMTAVALNGRSFTDLMALQPGIVPMSTQTPDSIVMAGATVAIAPSGGLNPGNQSISGQREDANGFMINGGDVKELMNGGTSIVPNLDSIAEFRILTNNFDAQYGNYSGGIINVVTKSGGNDIHGDAFEFLRNTDLDARNFFSPERSFYRQNQFGGTVGGPIRNNKVFYFADYQGTRTNQGIDTGLISVPTLAERSGNFQGVADALTGIRKRTVYREPAFAIAGLRRFGERALLYARLQFIRTVRVSERDHSATGLVGAGPASAAIHPSSQRTGHPLSRPPPIGETMRDDKGSFRIDADTGRRGLFSAYYYFDDYTLNNPYPAGQGGATVPGFDALTLGRGTIDQFGPHQDIRPHGGQRISLELHARFE